MYYLHVSYRDNLIRRHSNLECTAVQEQRKADARMLTIEDETVQSTLQELRTNTPFTEAGDESELWIKNAISDSLQSMRVVGAIKNALGDNDARFKSLELVHCEACGD